MPPSMQKTMMDERLCIQQPPLDSNLAAPSGHVEMVEKVAEIDAKDSGGRACA